MTVPHVLPLLVSAFILVVCALAALRDVVSRIIPNGYCGLIALGGLLLRLMDGTAVRGVTAASFLFLLLSLCWRLRVLGGGDVKLLAACALAAPPTQLGAILFVTAISGAVLGLIYLVARRRIPAPAPRRPAWRLMRALRLEQWRLHRGGPLPYAVAIAFGFGATLLPAFVR